MMNGYDILKLIKFKFNIYIIFFNTYKWIHDRIGEREKKIIRIIISYKYINKNKNI